MERKKPARKGSKKSTTLSMTKTVKPLKRMTKTLTKRKIKVKAVPTTRRKVKKIKY